MVTQDHVKYTIILESKQSFAEYEKNKTIRSLGRKVYELHRKRVCDFAYKEKVGCHL